MGGITEGVTYLVLSVEYTRTGERGFPEVGTLLLDHCTGHINLWSDIWVVITCIRRVMGGYHHRFEASVPPKHYHNRVVVFCTLSRG